MYKRLIYVAGFVLLLCVDSSVLGALPAGWSNHDISVYGRGSASESDGTWTVTGGGNGIYNESHYVHHALRADGEIVARVVNIEDPTDRGRKAGVMIRESLFVHSKCAFMGMTPSGGEKACFQCKTVTGLSGSYDHCGTPADYAGLPYWIKIVRDGNTYSAYHSPDGIAWTQQGESQTFDMAEEIYVGLAVTSQERGTLCTATFDNVSITEVRDPKAARSPSPDHNSRGVPRTVTISWEAGAGAASHEVWFGTDPDALEHIATNPIGNESYDLPLLDYNTSYYWAIVEVDEPDRWVGETWTFHTEADLPVGWSSQDIDDMGYMLPGSASYGNGVWSIAANGGSAGHGLYDHLYYVYRGLKGDGQIIARVKSRTYTGSAVYVGVMIRESFADNSKFVNMKSTLTDDWEWGGWAKLQWRRETGGDTGDEDGDFFALPQYLKLVREDDLFTGYRSDNGVSWFEIGSTTVSMLEDVYIGLAVATPGISETPCTVTIDNLSIIGGGGQASNAAWDPYPGNNSTGVPRTVNLSWEAGARAAWHEVWFGTDPDSLAHIATNPIGNESYDLPVLDYSTKYYWAIVEVNEPNTWSGETWDFETEAEPSYSKGSILREWWFFGGMDGRLDSLKAYPDFPNNPNGSEFVSMFEGPEDWGERYGSRIHGWLHPENTGNYTFWIASDEESELWLSTDADPTKAVVIANVIWWTASRGWTEYASQQSEPIHLIGGEMYYICALHKEGVAEDNLAVAWSGPDSDGEIEVIPGHQLSPFVNLWASDPNPDNNSIGVPRAVTLSWEAGAKAAWHEVWFGTDPDALEHIATNPIGNESYDLPLLDYNTRYYWAIVEVDEPNTWAGETWNFRTETDPSTSLGRILREWWFISGGDGTLDSLKTHPDFPDNPDGNEFVTSFEGPVDWDDDYGSRIHGWLHPENTGDYIFWIASDDESELWLSTDADPTKAVVIANVASWTYPRGWTEYASQQSEPIHLIDGEIYYICALHMEGAGGDNLAVAWSGPNSNGEIEVIPGYHLSPRDHAFASNPMPQNGAEVADANLSWHPGANAIWHEVWFGTEPDALNLVATKLLGDESYDPGPLALSTAYYWRIVAVNEARPYSPWPGPVWSFTTPLDCNGNGIADPDDIAAGTSKDCNSNGIPDECDIANGASQDLNGNDIPDECEDCNGNGIPDSIDIATGTSLDCNGNGIPDECDIASGNSLDCNGNGIPDECDFADGTSLDCNGNGIPDECDIANGNGKDANRNFILDECETADPNDDCNGNGISDEFDLAAQSLDFEDPSTYELDECFDAAAGDFDGDGDLDIIVIMNDGLSLLSNNGNGTFREAVTVLLANELNGIWTNDQLAIGDVDNDNDLDVVVLTKGNRENIKVLRNSGDATFELWGEYPTGGTDGYPHSPCLGDLDADGDLDLAIVLPATKSISVFLNTGDGVFEPNSTLPTTGSSKSMIMHDFDNDDDLDLAVVTEYPNEVVLFLNSGNGSFVSGQDYPLGDIRPRSMTGADFDGDGYIDLCFSEYDGVDPNDNLYVLFNNRDGTFAPSTEYVLDTGPYGEYPGVTSADLDSDGNMDLIAILPFAESLLILMNNGHGVFSKPVSFPASGGSVGGGVFTAGLDGDGFPDIVLMGHHQVTVLLNKSIPASWDCNGNGIPDECDIANGDSNDCNGNGIPDECDIANGNSTDENDDGIPDECQPDVRVVPVAVLIDPNSTTEVRTTLADSVEGVVQGDVYYVEIWASDIGAENTGLTGMYLDVSFCGESSATALNHGGIFTSWTSGTIQPGYVDEFGGGKIPSGGGIEPEWVRIGWITMNAGLDAESCTISLLPGLGGAGALGRAVPWEFIDLASVDIQITPPMRNYDLTGEGSINFMDLGIFAGSWQQDVPPAENEHDFDCDCYVGIGDLSWFATGWMKGQDDPTVLYPPCLDSDSCGGAAVKQSMPTKSMTFATPTAVMSMTSEPADADVAFELVVLDTPSASDATTELPTSIGSISEGETYYVEVWGSDKGDINTGITGAYMNLNFPAGAASVMNISHGSLFTEFTSGSIALGVIDELGGGTLMKDVGVAPQWARIAVIEMYADAAPPSVVFSLSPSSTRPQVAAYGRGLIDWEDVSLGRASVPPMIAGFVRTHHGRGVGGVIASADNGGGLGVTDSSGYYEVVVPMGWSGRVTPGSAEFSLSFDPDGSSYSDVTKIYDNQNYTARNICDMDDDDQVNTADFAYFADYWLEAGDLPGNFDLQDTVSFFDLDIFAKNWLWTP